MVPRLKPALYLGIPALLALSTVLVRPIMEPVDGLRAQSGAEEVPTVSRTPSGLTHDGTNFWYSDPRERRVYRIPPLGRAASYFVGNIRLYGIQFNPADGHVYLGSSKRLLKINPVTGGVAESISVPVSRVAGIAFGPGTWYLLEKGRGIVHFYSPELGRVIDTMRTGRKELRDIAVFRGNIWMTDGKTGVIYRYRAENKTLTGSVRGPAAKMRGLAFRRGQLWIINRGRGVIERLPYSETDHYIVSGESRYLVRVKVSMKIPGGLARKDGHVIVLQPPTTTVQRPGAIQTADKQWRNRFFTGSGERVFSRFMKAGGGLLGKRLEFEYRYAVTARNIRWFIASNYKPGNEDLDESPAYFFTKWSPARFNQVRPHALLRDTLKRAKASDGDSIWKALRESGMPARWTMNYRLEKTDGGDAGKQVAAAQVYLRNLGWVDLNPPLEDPENARLFSRNMDNIQLYRMPDIRARGRSIAYFVEGQRVSGARDIRAIPADVQVTLQRRAR